jgi:hemoglobin
MSLRPLLPLFTAFAMMIVAITAPVRADENPAPADPSLLPVFKQFGEKPGIVAVVDELMVQLVSDPRTRSFFADVDQKHIKAELVDQFCVILGGPCEYTGKGMKKAHEGLTIDEAAFNALVEDLQIAMDKRDVPFRAQNKLLQKLASMHREVVNAH